LPKGAGLFLFVVFRRNLVLLIYHGKSSLSSRAAHILRLQGEILMADLRGNGVLGRRAFLCSAGTALSFPLAAFAAGEKPTANLRTRQLFLGDDGIAKIENLRRTMHQPTKRGAVVRSANASQTIQTRSAPVWDDGQKVFKFWVLGTDQNFRLSSDGLHWTAGPKPNMRTDLAVYDPLDKDPSRRFKAALLNEGFAVSPDGIHWKRLNVRAIASSDEGNLSYQPSHGVFLHTVKRGGPHGRAVAIATSRDFMSWTDHGLVFHADKRDQELGRENIKLRLADRTLQQTFYNEPAAYNVDVYNMGVFWYEGLYMGMPAMYHATGRIPNYPNTDGFHLIQLMCSRNLRTWRRLGNRQPFIGPSRLDSGAYDLTQILPPSAPVVRDDELWFYYTGLKYRSNWRYEGTFPRGKTVPIPGRDRDVGAVCLAVLRRDGFISLDAGDRPGTLISKAFVLSGSRMFLNVDARDGEIRVEVLDQNGKVRLASRPIIGDRVRGEVSWERGRPAELKNRAVTFRFTLRNARFYSYWLQD
jgi:hypothetical protein